MQNKKPAKDPDKHPRPHRANWELELLENEKMEPGRKRMKPPYWGGDFLPPQPECRPRDLERAAQYARKIDEVLESGTLERRWTSKEREQLRRLLKIWQRRAKGEDDKFNRWGTKRVYRNGQEETMEQKSHRQMQQCIDEVWDMLRHCDD